MFRTMYAQSSETLWYVGTWIFSLLAWNISRLPIFKVLNKPVGRNRWSFLPLTLSRDLAELPWMKRRCRNRGTDCRHISVRGRWQRQFFPIQHLLISPLLFGNLRALLVLPLFIKDSYLDFAGHGSFAFWNQSNRKLCPRYLNERYLMKWLTSSAKCLVDYRVQTAEQQ